MTLSDQVIFSFVAQHPGAGRKAIHAGAVPDASETTLAPMSFTAMNDGEYIDALIGVYELNDVALLRETYVDAYLASAKQYRPVAAARPIC